MASDKDLQKKMLDEMRAASSPSEVKKILKKYKNTRSPVALGVAFEKLFIDEDGFSAEIPMTTLVKLHPGFKTSNGNDWCRSDVSYLGKRYDIQRDGPNSGVISVTAEGKQKNEYAQRIRNDIRKEICSKPCAVLYTNSRIECDHKDGKKDDWKVADPKTQRVEDFQPLCKIVNSAKKRHCKECKRKGERFDAKKLGYKESFTHGNAKTKTCVGCYWYDPKRFNEEISAQFRKKN